MARAAPIQAPKPAGRTRAGEKLQAKLAVGPANDRFEHEANRIADSVTAGLQRSPGAPPPTISGIGAQRMPTPAMGKGPEKTKMDAAPPEKRAQRAPASSAGTGPKKADMKSAAPDKRVQRTLAPTAGSGPEKTDKDAAAPEKRAQRATKTQGPETAPKATSKSDKIEDRKGATATKIAQGERMPSGGAGAEGGTAPDRVEASVERTRRRSVPGLDTDTRARMEQAIGTDFGGVRVHADQAADQAAQSLGARAFTVGQDMFFAQGQFNPNTTAGQRLIAHELTHTVQQRGGSAGAQRVQRAGGGTAQSNSSVEQDKEKKEAAPPGKTKSLSGTDWAIDVSKTDNSQGTLTVPKLELPEIGGTLKGTRGKEMEPAAIEGVTVPERGKRYERPPIKERKGRQSEAAYQVWLKYAREKFSAKLAASLDDQFGRQKRAAPVSDEAGLPVYVVKRAGVKATTSQFLVVGTAEELSVHDVFLRPMLKNDSGAYFEVDADHVLEDQLGGLDAGENMWLLDRHYNRSIGPQISDHIDKTINATLDLVEKERTKQKEKTGVELDGKPPRDAQDARQHWTIIFKTVGGGKFEGEPKTFWTQPAIEHRDHLKYYQALTEDELIEQGFKFDTKKKVKPDYINVFPDKSGGRASRFKVSKDAKTLQLPGFFFKGVDVVSIAQFTPPSAENIGGVLAVLNVSYTKKKDSSKKDSELVQAEGPITVQHDKRLGFGGYVTRDSIREAFKDAKFEPFSPLSFPDVHLSLDGELVATGEIESAKALLPKLAIPIELRGSDIFINFPIPTDKLSFGPVSVTDAALELGVGANGFFMAGSADIAVEQVGHGTIAARVEKDDVILKGLFNLDLDFLNPAQICVIYSLAKDDFVATAKLGIDKKKAPPGVESGQVTITISRNEFGLLGSLQLGGLLKGSEITAGYTKATGLVIEGKDLPLPVNKLPGVSDAKVTVRAVRSPETGVWLISGGGKASLVAPGATGTLDIFFDGVAVTFKGRAVVAKGPASGWLDVTATNRAVDDAGNPVEGGRVGELKIWGKGEASVKFGKILTGTVGIEYTPDGHLILSGEIALPPTFELFKKIPYHKSLLSVHPPDFPIWGIELGPVEFGIFAFVEAEIRFDAYVGPGELRDTKLKATLDLEKPEEATVEGHSQFYVPAYAGLTLDLGGGLKASAAVAYVKGKIGLEGMLGALIEGSFDVNVNWNAADGFAVGADAKIAAHPKFELGVYASVTAGVDLWLTSIEKEWGPWRHKLGEFGPNMELGVEMPLHWSERDGLALSLDDIKVTKPQFDAVGLMKDAFDTLV
jgi:hypothetical protein